ncbi:MAG: glycosyltransferase family 2 protein [Bacteroidota bacterium]
MPDMKVAGFTFVRNAIRFDYPVEASIRSLLPLVDELVVCLGNSDDDTESLIHSIGDSKIRIIHSTWDDSLRQGGRVLAEETNKALNAVSNDADWCIYIQADEVIHESDYPAIRQSMAQHLGDPKTEGLLFDYLHFYGGYAYVGTSRRWYRHEVRIVRNNPAIRSFRDAQGFRISDRKLKVRKANGRIFHYGWVKNPLKQVEKLQQFHKLWHDDATALKKSGVDPYDYLKEVDVLSEYSGTHPSTMLNRAENQDWSFVYDTKLKKMRVKDQVLFWIERLTGKRLFEYKNYTLLS